MINLEPLLFNLYSILYLLDVFSRTKESCSEVLFKKKKKKKSESFGLLWFSQTTQDPPFGVKYGVQPSLNYSVGGWDPEKGERQVGGRGNEQYHLWKYFIIYSAHL